MALTRFCLGVARNCTIHVEKGINYQYKKKKPLPEEMEKQNFWNYQNSDQKPMKSTDKTKSLNVFARNHGISFVLTKLAHILFV